MKQKWTCEQANEWYIRQGWLRGCNFIGSDCCSRFDMYQSYDAQKHLETADRELELCHKIGFNVIRIFANFDVWYQEHESYMDMIENYISLAAKHGLKVIFGLTGEAVIPRGDHYVAKWEVGHQDFGFYHMGRKPLTEEELAKTPHHFLELDDVRDCFLKMISCMMEKYRNDERIVVWNVYNEPGIVLKERAVPLVKEMFSVCRSFDPVQPLCADVWTSYYGKTASLAEQVALELSDVISFHSYMPYDLLVPQIKEMKKLNRPIFMTEWLHRVFRSEVRDLYPLFYLENIACCCWGFVLGKTQTNEPWEDIWKHYESGDPNARYDFTRWQHDLFRTNLRPYDPEEIKLIQKYNQLADENNQNV